MTRRNEKPDLLGRVMEGSSLLLGLSQFHAWFGSEYRHTSFYCSALLCFKDSAFFFFFLTNLKVCGNPVLSGDTLVGNIFKLRYLHYF